MEIAAWATEQEEVLRTFLELPHSIPSHDTFNQVFAMLKPETLQEVLLPWLGECAAEAMGWVEKVSNPSGFSRTAGILRPLPAYRKAIGVAGAWVESQVLNRDSVGF